MKKLTPIEDIIAQFPLSAAGEAQVKKDREEIKRILSGEDDRLIFILGPCSAWPYESMLNYAERLKELSEEVSGSLKLLIRVYTQKPRTITGWMGPANQPDPFAPADIDAGTKYSRKLMVELVEMGLALADEAVFVQNTEGFVELLSWVAVGARSTENLAHRIFASATEVPVGMKNPTSGSIEIGVNGVIAAQHPHTTVQANQQVETPGNPFAHLVLRGGTNGPNFHLNHLLEAKLRLTEARLKHPTIIVDASHDNSRTNVGKDPKLQGKVIEEVIQNLSAHPELQENIKGFMLESFLKSGNQKIADSTPETIDRNGLSITDPCLGWEETEALVKNTAKLYKSLKA